MQFWRTYKPKRAAVFVLLNTRHVLQILSEKIHLLPLKSVMWCDCSRLVSTCSYALDKQGPKGTMYVQKQWATNPEPHPYQTTVVDITAHAPELRERRMTLEDLFPPKSHCFLISPPHYGSPAEVGNISYLMVFNICSSFWLAKNCATCTCTCICLCGLVWNNPWKLIIVATT